MELVDGRIFLEGIADLPVITLQGFVGVPGQTLPLTEDHPRRVSMLKNIIQGNHTFGIMSCRYYTLPVNFIHLIKDFI